MWYVCKCIQRIGTNGNDGEIDFPKLIHKGFDGDFTLFYLRFMKVYEGRKSLSNLELVYIIYDRTFSCSIRQIILGNIGNVGDMRFH